MAERTIKTSLSHNELRELVSAVTGPIVQPASISLTLVGIKRILAEDGGVTASADELAEALTVALKEYLERNNPNINNVHLNKSASQLGSDQFTLEFDLVVPDRIGKISDINPAPLKSEIQSQGKTYLDNEAPDDDMPF